jgi:putative toxin-antitoxin system antitoxin component (TIGR02293 family)
MLTTADKQEIKRLVGEAIAEMSSSSPRFLSEKDVVERMLAELVTQLHADSRSHRDLKPGNLNLKETRTTIDLVDPIVDVTARAFEVFGTRGKALRWLKTPVRALNNQSPISLLSDPECVARVNDVLGQVEHGIW